MWRMLQIGPPAENQIKSPGKFLLPQLNLGFDIDGIVPLSFSGLKKGKARK